MRRTVGTLFEHILTVSMPHARRLGLDVVRQNVRRPGYCHSDERLLRDVVLYLLHTHYRLSMRSIGRQRGCAHSLVWRAVRQVEDWRDNPLVDRTLSDIESALQERLAA